MRNDPSARLPASSPESLLIARAEARAEDAQRQLEATERLGGLGSYDWDMVTGRLTWSDELFRIYGYEPGAFEPSYEGFLERVVPDDRDRIREIHEEALRTAGTFETEERIVRADGRLRILLTNGTVLKDGSGEPVRLHGVCRDVTDERTAREHARRAAARFETLIEASPDAIVVVDPEGRILSVNPQAERFFGYTGAQLTAMSVDELVPLPARGRHGQRRAAYATNPSTRPMAAGTDLEALRADGTLVPVDIALSPLEGEGEGAFAAFVRDASPRRRAELDARRLVEAQMRRRQALELNDNVVQGLVALLWELDDDVSPSARRVVERTLGAARRMMSDLLEDLPGGPGTLVRTSQVWDGTPAPPTVPAPAAPSEPGTLRVLIADDAPELRALLRSRLERLDGVELVGEAGNGREAVDLCERLEPDLVLLDLSMPELDGLQAAELIGQRVPRTRIHVLSGYPAAAMEQRALQAGAEAYHEKRGTLDGICEAVTALARRS